MRLISLTVRNYRLHRDLTIEFDPDRNLIGGPNETGKSTLAEAIHRALFMRHRAGGELQKSMVSDVHGGTPEVQLSFEAAGDTWTIEKKFAGATKGTARLSSRSGISLQGDAAEEKLAELTGNNAGSTNTLNQIINRWSHLWVWQGSAGLDASVHTSQHRSELIQRLQEQGLAAVMQSATDDKTREKIQRAYDAIFTTNGKPKANSRLDLAIKSLSDATAKLEEASAQKSRLEDALVALESANQDIASAEATLPAFREQLVATQASLAQAHELAGTLDHHKNLHNQAHTKLSDLTKADAQILNLLAQAQAAREALIPAETNLATLAEQVIAAATRAKESRATWTTSQNAIRSARQQHEFASAYVTRLEKSASHQILTEKAETVATNEKTLADAQQALSKLPAISADQLESLRLSETHLAQAQVALETIATGIEVIACPQSIQLGKQTLAPGTSSVIIEPTELTFADGTHLRIQPGGGNSLAVARQKVADQQSQLTTLLDQFAVSDSRQAAEIVSQRQALEQSIAATKSRLKDLRARDLPEALSTAVAELAAAHAEVERRQAALSDSLSIDLPSDLASAKLWQAQSRFALEEEEQREEALRAEAEIAEGSHQEKFNKHQSAQQALEAKRREINDLETSVRTLEQNHGDATTRARAISEAHAQEVAARSQLDATKAAMAELQPERLAQEVRRLDQVISQAQTKLNEARMRRAVAENTLASDGTSDPEANLLRAKARFASAQDEHAREKRHADAIALLHQLFTNSQQAISKSVTQPIAERVSSYLECIYGRGVRIEVDWDDDPQKSSIRITRPGMPTFDFDTLSGGAKEQVAAAVRLATAEILAHTHQGTLPILFDDSFAFSDDSRIQSLQSMLYQASRRGLQLIVLSCTPAAYSGLAAKEIKLNG